MAAPKTRGSSSRQLLGAVEIRAAYRLRVLDVAEEETLRAAELAASRMQLAIARKQLQDIRTLKQSAVRNVHWTKPLTGPAVLLAAMIAIVFVVMFTI
jgi:hypothetical protein